MNQELRQIIWKESYLTKRLVAVLLALGMLGIIGGAFDWDSANRISRMLIFVNVLTVVVAFAVGATMFAGETEYDTDRLLQRFGVSPGSILLGKFLIGIVGLIVLWVGLALFSTLMDSFARLSAGEPLTSLFHEVKAQEFWGSLGLVVEALLCGVLCSCWFKRVLTALTSAVVLFFVSLFLIKYGIDGIRFHSPRSEEIASSLTHVSLILLLLIGNWYSISRWFAGNRRGFSVSISLPRFRTGITSRFHECSPQKRFVTRIIWYELRQHALIWLAVAFFSILSPFVFPYGSPFVVCFVVPLLMGLISCYSEQNRDRARFWYQRGASTATYWWSKNIIWLSLLGLIFVVPSYFMLINFLQEEIAWQIENYYSTEYSYFGANLSEATVPQLTDFPSNLWFYVLLLYFIGQWAIVRVPHAILAAICAVAGSLVGIALMNLCQFAYVPLWIVLIPIIISLALSSYWACENMLRDLPDPGNRHRRRMLVFPVGMMICCVLFCGYRARGVVAMLLHTPNYPYEESYSPEKILASPDEAYSDKYFELMRSFPSYTQILQRAEERVKKKAEEGKLLEYDFSELLILESNKLYKIEIRKQKKRILELAHLLDARYKSDLPMRINLLKQWRPEPDFQRGDPYIEQLIPEFNFSTMLRHGLAQEEWLLPLSNKEMIRLLWNLGEANAHLGGNQYGSVGVPVPSNVFLGQVYSEKNLQRLYDQEDAASLRELIAESIERESRITSMQQIVELWFAYANYQLDHDDEYVWEYLCGIPWNGKNKQERWHEEYLIEKLLHPPRWTILPTEKFRARALLDEADGYYRRQAQIYDSLLKNQIAVSSVSDRIENQRKAWLQSGDNKRLFGSTWAVYDLSREATIMYNSERYVNIYARHRMHRTMFALFAFAKEKNRYPDKLEELVPDYLEKLPVDPWTGKPFGYVGPNFTGKIDLPNKDEDEKELTYPFLWLSSRWYDRPQEVELVETVEKSQPQHYIFASRKDCRDRVLTDDNAADLGTFEEAASQFEVYTVHITELPVLPNAVDNKRP